MHSLSHFVEDCTLEQLAADDRADAVRNDADAFDPRPRPELTDAEIDADYRKHLSAQVNYLRFILTTRIIFADYPAVESALDELSNHVA